jgi:hypothetical protein
MLGFPAQTGLREFEAARVLSEGARQNDVGAALHTFQTGGTQSDYDAAIRAATIAHYRRLIASAQEHGIASGDFQNVLRDLGTAGS